ncbi:cation:proton antiporter [Amphibiibacter pelophylacis]|uniref:Cation:proton antiporter n=1 Tax=Amphibiibacter pelophylacis TaxID=1799477 RepID=A0ACC6NZ04_9BURK
MHNSLDIVLLYLLAAVSGVVVFRSLRLPPMLGYLVVGVLIGPHALALARDSERVEYLAEFGVVFLMFVIGLEFNLPKLRSMQRLVFGLGLSQVLVTMAGAVIGHLALAAGFAWMGWQWGLHWTSALALGGAMAMSSTAIVMKLMAERTELESEHGRRVVGILLFQDLAVVPLLILIPALGTHLAGQAAAVASGAHDLGDQAQALGESLLIPMLTALAKAAVVLTLLLVGGQKLMNRWLTLVAKRQSDELFMLNILLLTLGLAWLTEHFGLSLALGAFLAGMLIAETPYKHQVESDIRPFHDILLGLFFITIGMKLNWLVLLDHWLLVLVLTIFPVLFKAGLITGLALLGGARSGVAIRTGLYLAQAGEFGFVLLTLAVSSGLIERAWISPVLASMVLSMLATPFMIAHADRIVNRLSRRDWMMSSLAITTLASKSMKIRDHVIIAGYGRCGQNLARLLTQQGIPFVALDLDPDRVSQAAAAGDNVVYGDANRMSSLVAAGLSRASAIAITHQNTRSALRTLHHVHDHAPHVPALVRTVDSSDMPALHAAGATVVVPEALEGSLMLASHALALLGVPVQQVQTITQQARDAQYELLRGYFHGADDDLTTGDQQEVRLLSVTLPPACRCAGMALGDLAWSEWQVRALHLRRPGDGVLPARPELLLQPGDTLVLSGQTSGLDEARAVLMAL